MSDGGEPQDAVEFRAPITRKSQVSKHRGKPREIIGVGELAAMLAILAALWFAASYVFFAGVMSHLPQDVWAVVTIRDITSFFLKNSFVVLLLIAVFLILGILQFFMPVPTDERLKYLWHFPQFRKFSRCVAIALAITAFIVLLLSARGFYFGNMMPAEAYFPDTIPLLGSAIIGLFSGAYGLSKWAPRFKLIIQAAPWLVVVSMALFFWGDVVGSAKLRPDICAAIEGENGCFPLLLLGENYAVSRKGNLVVATPVDKIRTVEILNNRPRLP